MNFRIISDIHFEFHRDHGKSFFQELGDGSNETIIIAGDIGVGAPMTATLLLRFSEQFKHVIFVIGNHEYYHQEVTSVEPELRKLLKEHSNIHFLEQQCITIEGVTIAGTTLWFRDDSLNAFHKRSLNDFNYIKGFDDWIYPQNNKCQDFISGLNDIDIVVTHHLPSALCVPPEYATSELNRFFVCDMSFEIERLKPKYWIHGHTHGHVDVNLGETKIIANPFGYPHEDTKCNLGLTVEL